MPNLRGASPVGRDDGGRSYAARADDKGKPKWSQRCRGEGVGRSYVTRADGR